MWMNYLRLGSIVMLCCLLSGCDTSRTEYVHHGEWVYRNESSYKIEIKGAISCRGPYLKPLRLHYLRPKCIVLIFGLTGINILRRMRSGFHSCIFRRLSVALQ